MVLKLFLTISLMMIPNVAYAKDVFAIIDIVQEISGKRIINEDRPNILEKQIQYELEKEIFESRVKGHYCVRHQEVYRGIPVTRVNCQ